MTDVLDQFSELSDRTARQINDAFAARPAGGGGLLSSGVISLSSAQLLNLANPGGAIVTTTKGAAGSGYAPGDTGGIHHTEDVGNNGSYLVDTVDGGGGVLTYTITDPGTEYPITVGAETGATTGDGTGLTVNITAVNASGAIKIVDAPGANKAIIVTEVLSTYNFNTLDYPSLTPVLIYGVNESVSYNADIAPFLGLAESAVLNSTFEGNNFTKAIAANAAVNLKVISGDPSVGSGDGTGTIEVFYRIVSWP